MLTEFDLYGLAYNCPAIDRLIDCPFKEIEHLEFQEKVKWVEGLSQEEKKILLEVHKVCSYNRS
jgi:hypothetical protein